MKKAILISIRPEWVAKILNGEKTIEIRKTAPKCKLPIDVYIYCTKGNRDLSMDTHHCCIGFDLRGDTLLNGKIVAKFTLRKVDGLDMANPYDEPTRRLLDEARITLGEARTYASGTHPRYNPLFAWHISDLEVFEEPKELSKFFSLPETYHHDHESMVDYYERKEARRLKRAPQSWQYVEVEE